MHLLFLCASLFMGLPGSGAEHLILFRSQHALDTVEEVQALTQHGRLVAIDQEGDRLCHLRGQFTQFPGNCALGSIQDLDLTRRVGEALSQELRACHINTLLGPVLDLYSQNPVIGTRAFSADPDLVIAHAQAFLEGLSPLLAVGKHVPGHGATLTNSHLSMPQMELQEEHLRPFKALCHQLPLLMVGHFAIRYPNDLKNWDLDRVKAPGFDDLNQPNITNIEQVEIVEPRELSRSSKTNSSGHLGIDLPLCDLIKMIRSDWGYEGVIMTDDLTMDALSGPLIDRAVDAFLAGCDLLLICHTEDLRPLMAEFSERVPPERIAESLARIEALPLPPPIYPNNVKNWDLGITFQSHRALAQEVATRALSPGPLELIDGKVKVIAPAFVHEQIQEGIQGDFMKNI
ncbi:MAG: glycoside hydrolase family 3 protein [Verrucomicrobia bacterium]|nr:glycoside hydrolase family 3 protein [Verrucomicrobiota bacterium]